MNSRAGGEVSPARQRAQSLPTWEETAGLFFSNLREVLEEVDAAR